MKNFFEIKKSNEFNKNVVYFFHQLNKDYNDVKNIYVLITHTLFYFNKKWFFKWFSLNNFDHIFTEKLMNSLFTHWLKKFFNEENLKSVKEKYQNEILNFSEWYDSVFFTSNINKQIISLYWTLITDHMKILFQKYFSLTYVPNLLLNDENFINTIFNWNKEENWKIWKNTIFRPHFKYWYYIENVLLLIEYSKVFFEKNIHEITWNYWFYYLFFLDLLEINKFLNEIIKRRVFSNYKQQYWIERMIWDQNFMFNEYEKILKWEISNTKIYEVFQKLLDDKYLIKTRDLYNCYMTTCKDFEKYFEILKNKMNDWYLSFLDNFFDSNMKKYWWKIDFKNSILWLWRTN